MRCFVGALKHGLEARRRWVNTAAFQRNGRITSQRSWIEGISSLQHWCRSILRGSRSGLFSADQNMTRQISALGGERECSDGRGLASFQTIVVVACVLQFYLNSTTFPQKQKNKRRRMAQNGFSLLLTGFGKSLVQDCRTLWLAGARGWTN